MSNHSIIKNIITSNIKGACRCACTLLLFSSFSPVIAQRHEILSPTITSLQVVAGKDWLLPPITQLGGEPINSVVSVSSVGTQKNKESKKLFLQGYEEMMIRLEPSLVIFYGIVPEECEGNIIKIQPFYGKFGDKK